MAEQPSAPQLPPPLPPLPPLPQPPPHLPYPPIHPFAASFYQPSERGFSTALRFLLTRRLREALTARNVFETRDAIDKALSTLSLVANCKPEVRAAVQLEASELWAISATLSDRLGPPHHLVHTPRVAPHLPPTWSNPSPQTTPSSTMPSSPPPEDKNGTSRKRKRQ
jgi:hypothetical protein